MAKTNRGIPADIAAQLNQLDQDRKARQRPETLGMVALPGGKEITIEELVGGNIRPDNLYFHGDFANPEKFLKAPKPECKYVWKVYERKNGIKQDSNRHADLLLGIRRGNYRYVTLDELEDTANLPISTLEMFQDDVAGTVDAVVLKGLVLIEVQPEAVTQEYRQREMVAALRANPKLGESMMRSALNNMGVKESQVELETVVKDTK